MKRRALLSLMVAALAPAGCGWHLRGSEGPAVMPFSAIRISDRGTEFALIQQVQRTLDRAGVAFDPKARLELRLAPTRWHVTRSSYTRLGGTASELISLKQPFEVWRDGKLIIRDRAEVYRDYSLTGGLAAAEAERRSIKRQMRREAASQIIEQLRNLPDDRGR